MGDAAGGRKDAGGALVHELFRDGPAIGFQPSAMSEELRGMRYERANLGCLGCVQYFAI
jgi:hypothetical protein